MKYHIVDAFTNKPFGGNTAGVVRIEPQNGFPTDETMRLIAEEFRYSETAFIKAEADGSFTTHYYPLAKCHFAVMPPSLHLAFFSRKETALQIKRASTNAVEAPDFFVEDTGRLK